jgi:hypothetical protein
VTQVQLPVRPQPSAEPTVSDSDVPALPSARIDPAEDTASKAGAGETRQQAGSQTNSARTADPSDAASDEEAELTARLNASQMRRGTEVSRTEVSRTQEETASPDPVSQPPPEVGAVDPPVAAQQAIDQPPAPSREAIPQRVAQEAAPPTDPGTGAVAATSPPMSEQAIAAREVAARSKATADRKLREWCKAQRRRCTFPTQP